MSRPATAQAARRRPVHPVCRAEIIRRGHVEVTPMTVLSRRILLAGSIAVSLLPTALSAADNPREIRLDWATYNPVSMVLKDKGWLEKEFAKDGISIRWVQTLGSNKALEFLNAGSIDFGSTAGSAALVAKINGNPIKSIYVKDHPDLVRRVLAVYEEARKYSLANYGELKKTFIAGTKLPDAVVDKQLKERTDLTFSRIGAPQRESILAAGLALQQAGVIAANVDVRAAVDGLIDDRVPLTGN
jgi:ABC-type nitrate/sulfonate/bicarbonate transport system substrate-binding protein